MLEVSGLTVAYGHAAVVREVSLAVRAHQVVALLGPNGAGKTTLARCIAGYLRPRAGRVALHSGEMLHELTGRSTWEIARRGVVYVPESGHTFPSLTVSENLGAALSSFPGSLSKTLLADMWEMFAPLAPLRQQRAGTLSGGEGRLLGIARAVLFARALVSSGAMEGGGSPVLILDEPSSGLSPVAVGRVGRTLRDLAQQGWSMLLVEQMAAFALGIAGFAYVMARGEVVSMGPAGTIRADQKVRQHYLGGAPLEENAR
jgi:branched-chain amino acid transport system ATP-binding protein